MLSIQNANSKKCTPNLLPARINHNGPINGASRYWTPTTDEKGTKHVHFRGRHLYGTSLPLPSNYTGAVLNITDKLAPQPHSQPSASTATKHHSSNDFDEDDGQEDVVDETPEEVKIAEQVGSFEEITVWGHGGEVDEGADMYVGGMREWIGFAESMHGDVDGESEWKAAMEAIRA